MMVVGAVGASNLNEFLRAGASCAGIGGELVSRQLVDDENYDEIERRAREFAEIIKK